MTKFRPLPSAEELRDHFEYEPLTGLLLREGRGVGSVQKNGYRIISYKGKGWQAHRLTWMWHHGTDPGPNVVDHINWCKADNRIWNLRVITPAQNNRWRKDARAMQFLEAYRALKLGSDLAWH